MRIVNQTRGNVLAERAWEAASLRERLKGLLGRNGLGEGEALVIRPCTSIHSFFMRFAFDAAFFDATGRVVHVVHQMRPYRLSRVVRGAVGVVELAAGTLRATDTLVGDRLGFDTSYGGAILSKPV